MDGIKQLIRFILQMKMTTKDIALVDTNQLGCENNQCSNLILNYKFLLKSPQ